MISGEYLHYFKSSQQKSNMPKTPSSGAYTTKDCQAGSTCKECGASDHAKAECSKQRCYFCQGMGHIETQCPKYYDEYPSMGENEETETNGEETTPDNGATTNNEAPNAWKQIQLVANRVRGT